MSRVVSRKWMMRLMDSPSNCCMRKCPKFDTDFCIHFIVLWRTVVKALLVSVINMHCMQSCIVAFQHTVSRNNKGRFVIGIKVGVWDFWRFKMLFPTIFDGQLRLRISSTLPCFYDAIYNFCLGVLTFHSSVLTFHSHRTIHKEVIFLSGWFLGRLKGTLKTLCFCTSILF